MEHLSNYHEDHSNAQENSYKLCVEKGHPIFSLKESQWKLSQQHDRISQWMESYCTTNTWISRNKYIQQSRTVGVTVRDQGRKLTI